MKIDKKKARNPASLLGCSIFERYENCQRPALQPGMLITDEPGYYEAGWGGLRIEDTVLVTEGGCERLTTSEKDLKEIH